MGGGFAIVYKEFRTFGFRSAQGQGVRRLRSQGEMGKVGRVLRT